MSERLLRICIEGTFGLKYEISKKTIDIVKDKNGVYWCKVTKLDFSLKKVIIKREISSDKVNNFFKALSGIEIPAFPVHEMGKDGGFTEVQVGGYDGGAHYRWWSVPPKGWEDLSEVTAYIMREINIDDLLDDSQEGRCSGY